jgi:hypothetical protein
MTEKAETPMSLNPKDWPSPGPVGMTLEDAKALARARVAERPRSLRAFLETAGTLTRDERLTLINQAIVLLEGFYVHLPLKRAMHAVDPGQRLRLLRRRVDQLTETRFHAEMVSIFNSLRDLHTRYLLPAPYNAVDAVLPFMIEEYFEGDQRIYMVSKTSGPIDDPKFEKGVVVTHWNGVPIERAVASAGDRDAGSNADARRGQGLANLTLRPLAFLLPPDEEWVIVSFRDLDGEAREARFEWQVQGLPPVVAEEPAAPAHAPGVEAPVDKRRERSVSTGLDRATAAVQKARRHLFAPHVAAAGTALATAEGDRADFPKGTASTMPDVFAAKRQTTSGGTFGYIRIHRFAYEEEEFVTEFVRLLGLMPREGLIIDVRDNPGGCICSGEQLLQTLTPRTIEPERLQFINTPLTQLLAEGPGTVYLHEWAPSIARAVETGAAFSCGFPITNPALCNKVGQRYHGPVVLITNARSYSTSDIFAAGFQDHGIGPVLGVDGNTGAGGANGWTHEDLMVYLGVEGDPTQPIPESPLVPLPREASMALALRRTIRVGKHAGTELEDLGVVPDHEHRMTRRDLLEGNRDLIESAGALLAAMPRYRLDATAAKIGGSLRIELEASNIDRLDFEIDGRPQRSVDVADGDRTFDLPTSLLHGTLGLKGYKAGELVAARRLAFA